MNQHIRPKTYDETAPSITVVIPSYNRRDSMLVLLADVFKQEHANFEVVVVDDCSPDDSVAAIKEAFPQVRLFVNEKNGGPAVTRNRGITEAKAEIVVGLDSDVTVPDTQCLKKVEQHFEELPQAAGLAFHLLQPDGVTEDFARWWHPVPIEDYSDKRFETPYFSGTGCAFRKSSLLEAGLYPEILYMHYEEYELAFRLLDTGKTIVYCPEICVIHHEHQVSRRSEIKTFYKHRNQILVTIALYPFWRGLAYIFPRTIHTFLDSVKHGYIKTYFRALKSAKDLAPIRTKSRKPLSRTTWKRIAAMKQGLLVPQPFNSKEKPS